MLFVIGTKKLKFFFLSFELLNELKISERAYMLGGGGDTAFYQKDFGVSKYKWLFLEVLSSEFHRRRSMLKQLQI